MLPPLTRLAELDGGEAAPSPGGEDEGPASVADPAPQALWADPAHLASIEALMCQLCTAGRSRGLGELVWAHVSSGGKRLRARLALAAVKALGGPPSGGIAWGACCELLHNASLIHDDIQDGDRYRRGRPSLWTQHGVSQAINGGDLLIALSYLAIEAIPAADALRWRLTRALSLAARQMVEGQAAELQLLAGDALAWDGYAACVEGKTAALFSLPIEGAALIAGRATEEAVQLGDAFRPLGLLFQIQDDILDLFGDNGREMRGSDLAQSGKATALVVEHLRLHPEDRGWLLRILTAPRAETPRASIEEAIERFARGGALAATWRRIDELLRDLGRSLVLAREPVLRALAERFAAEALRAVAHTRPGGPG